MKMWKTGYQDHTKFTYVGQINENTMEKQMVLYLKTFFYRIILDAFPFFIWEITTCVEITNFYILSSIQDEMNFHSKGIEHW